MSAVLLTAALVAGILIGALAAFGIVYAGWRRRRPRPPAAPVPPAALARYRVTHPDDTNPPPDGGR